MVWFKWMNTRSDALTTALIKYKGMHCRHSELRSVVNVDQSFLLFLELFKYADLTVFIPVLNSYIIYCF